MAALRRKHRKDSGQHPSLGITLRSVLQAQHSEHVSWSFKLHHDACRKRVKPPSVLFLGRRVYFGAAIVLSVMDKALTPERLAKLKQQLGDIP